MKKIDYLNGEYFGKEPTYENLKIYYQKKIKSWSDICKNYRSRENLGERRKWENLLEALEEKNKVEGNFLR